MDSQASGTLFQLCSRFRLYAGNMLKYVSGTDHKSFAADQKNLSHSELRSLSLLFPEGGPENCLSEFFMLFLTVSGAALSPVLEKYLFTVFLEGSA